MEISNVTKQNVPPQGAFAEAVAEFDAQIFETSVNSAITERLKAMIDAGQKGDTTTVIALLLQLRSAAGKAGSSDTFSLNDLFGTSGLGGLLSGPPPKSLNSVANLMQAPQTLGPKDSATTVSLWTLLADPNKSMSVDMYPALIYAGAHYQLLPQPGDDSSWSGPSFYPQKTDFGIGTGGIGGWINQSIKSGGTQNWGWEWPGGINPQVQGPGGFVLQITGNRQAGDRKSTGAALQGPASSFAAWIAGSTNFCSTLLKLLS